MDDDYSDLRPYSRSVAEESSGSAKPGGCQTAEGIWERGGVRCRPLCSGNTEIYFLSDGSPFRGSWDIHTVWWRRYQPHPGERIHPRLSNRRTAIFWAGAREDDLVDPDRFGGLFMLNQTFHNAKHAANRSAAISRVTQLTHLEFWSPSLHNPPFTFILPLFRILRISARERGNTLEQADVCGAIDLGQ